MKDHLRTLNISNPDVGKLRILVHGAVGAGKSSFINSIDSIFQERMTSQALAESISDHSFTKKFQVHYIKDGRYDSFLPFAICDIMGLEEELSDGVDTADLSKALQGHIKDDYTFNPLMPLSEKDTEYNRYPRLSDRIHCLVSVIQAKSISLMENNIIAKMKKVRAIAADMKIPQVAVLTQVDDTCPHVAKDIRLVYRSKIIREKMQVCSNKLGLPMNCIFPVKNYHEEIELNNDMDVLLLSSLTFILNFANDHVAVMGPNHPQPTKLPIDPR